MSANNRKKRTRNLRTRLHPASERGRLSVVAGDNPGALPTSKPKRFPGFRNNRIAEVKSGLPNARDGFLEIQPFAPNRIRNGYLTQQAGQEFEQAGLGQRGQCRIVTDDDHDCAGRMILIVSRSERTSATVVPGHTPCFERISRASQQDSRPSMRRTCSSESTPSPYPLAANASMAIREGSPKGSKPSSSGTSRVIITLANYLKA